MPADDRLPTYARFYVHSQLQGDPNPDKHNDPVYKDVVFAEVMIKGDHNTSFSRPKRKQDETDYPLAWKAFCEGNDDYTEGTPLKSLPGVGVSDQRNMNTDGIMCVEDLAALDDSVVVGNPGMTNLRKKARAFLDILEPEKAEAKEAARAAEIQEMKDQLAEMQDLRAQLAELQAKPEQAKPKRGRPSKAEA